MKKNYTVSLDEEKVEILKAYLEKGGMSFSGYLNQAVTEFVEAIGKMDLPDDVDRMPLGEFITAFGRMMKGMKKEP